ncbi:hypothetical protein BDY24DRAFT_374139 [Mrakia frigida]|uniref:uncharacterized protein n=1 Tax=Mrakia frigida TaxID=29902 RepID=UPI003FCC1BB5
MHYITAAVESLALRLHGGPEAHRAHVNTVNAKVQKQKETRAKNAAIAAEAEYQEALNLAKFGAQYSDLPGSD